MERRRAGAIYFRRVVDRLRVDGAEISDDELRGVSLLPFRHVMPNGTYFIEDLAPGTTIVREPTLADGSEGGKP